MDIMDRRESERILRLALDVLPIGILMVDEHGTIVLANAQVETLFGYTHDEVIGASIDVLVGVGATGDRPADRASIFTMPHAQAMAAGRGCHARRKNGSEFLAEIGLNRIHSNDRPLVLVSVMDVTEHYELQRSRQELAHITRISTMGELAASLAHELNQPLTAILSNVHAAQRFLEAQPIDVAEMQAILTDIAEDDRRASEVIRRMRELARKGELEVAPLDLATLIQEVAGLVQSDAIVRGVRLSMSIDADLPVIGDKVQLQQVMLNLLLNAFDAVKDCTAAERVVGVRAERGESDMVRVCVSDRGPGVSADRLDKIFTPFFTSKRDGLGLGLSISRSIIEAHGGRLNAANNPDRGATFEFVLPARDRS
jgi:two-component system, LuxR family, sensor kinase FixL